jgi:hypothetical protein
MALDPNISLGVKPLQLADPLAQYGQVAQIQAAQQSQQMNALRMQEAQDTMEERNALRRLDPSSADYESQLFRLNPQLGINYRKEAATTAAQKAAEKKSLTEAAAAKQKMMGQAYRDISGRPSDANINAHLEDVAESTLYNDVEKASITKRGLDLLALPFADRQIFLAQQGASASDLKPSVQVVDQSGQRQIVRVPAFGGAPTVAGTYADVPLPANVQAQKIQIARESRPPAQPAAPTITQIVDPSDPNKMITIDARRYQGGGVGSVGVIGVAGKEPGAALRQNKTEAGKTQLADDLENLRASFQALDTMRAIPSTERNVMSNLMSATAASGVGQTLGRAGGSPEQVERDVINSARMRLVNSIKNATGMSAQQLNSNVELQTMLKSISDPGQSVQAALRIIDDIDNAYVKGAGLPKRKPPADAANVVVTPDGQSHTFPTPAAAAQFKKDAGL